MKKAKMFAGVCAGVLALSSAMAVSAADYVEFNYEPVFEVDFEEFIYEEGMTFPVADATTHFKYSDLEIVASTAEVNGNPKVVDCGAAHGNAVLVDMSEAVPGETFAVQTATDLVHTFNSGKITVSYDMLIPKELDDEANENIFVQVVTSATDEIGKFGFGGNISYPVNEWFKVTANYYLSADNKSGQKELLFTDKYGLTTVITEKTDIDTTKQFFKGLVAGGIRKIRFYSWENQNHSFMIDNIKVSSLPTLDTATGEYVIEKQSRGTGDFLGGVTNKGTTYHASGIGGKDYTVARYEATEGQDLSTSIQTRRAYGKGVFIDDYVEYNAEYYFPTECNNIRFFQQMFFAEKYQTVDGISYGASSVNRNINPWEISNGKIDIYKDYASSYKSNPVSVPVNEWFTVKTKIYREKQEDAYNMYFSVELIIQSSGETVEIVPKTLFDYSSNNHASSYLANGIFSFRENFARTSSTKDAVGPFYIGNKSLMKSPAYEIGEMTFTDDEGFEIDFIDGIAGINAAINAVDYAGNGKNVMLWCAAYDENDMLIDAKIKAGQLPQGTPDIITLDDYFEIPDDASYFKAGLVDDNMTPLAFGYLE